MSKTKETLIAILSEQINSLQKGVQEMNEQALLKQIGKQKVLYNLTRKNNRQLAYSHLAMAEYCIKQQLFDAAIMNLHSSKQYFRTGDCLFLLGSIAYKKEQYKQAMKFHQQALKEVWIEPSQIHLKASKLECMTFLQKIYHHLNLKEKLIEISYVKIKHSVGHQMAQNNHYSLAMADLAIVFKELKDYRSALQKIGTAISFMEQKEENIQKLVEYLLLKAQMHQHLQNKDQQKVCYESAADKIERYPSQVNPQLQILVYESLIKSNLLK